MQMNRGALACLGGVMLFASAAFGKATPSTLPASEVRPGMRGYGLSVFRGTAPERFDIEVIDVLHNFRPDQDMVLIKTPHPLLDHAGSVAGMSGSPIYIDERLVGAYAYGWTFGKDPIAGVTPISNMLRELTRPLLHEAPLLASPLPAQAGKRVAQDYRNERRDAFWALSQLPALPPRGQLQPASTPLLVGGLPSRAAELLREKFAPLGLEVLEAAGGGTAKAKQPAALGYENGGSVAVVLLRGDVQATAVGTVTYVDGQRALAFGHPMLEIGELSLPTATSRVLHVLASERSSFKIAEALEPLGALVQDRQSAVVIDSKAKAHTIPVAIHLRGLPPGQRADWHVEAADHRLLTPSLVMTALSSAIGASLNDASDVMFKADASVTLQKYGVQRVVDEGFSPLGVGAPLAHLRLFDLLSLAYDNPFASDRVEKVDVTLDIKFAHDITEIIGAQLSNDELDPGEPARIVLTLRPYAGPVEQRIFEVPLAETLAGEHLELEVLPADHVRLEQPLSKNLGDILNAVRAGLPSTSLAITVERKARGLSLSGHVVQDLPASALDALASAHDTTRTLSFAMERRFVWPLGRLLVGSAKLGLDVRKEKR